MERCYVTSASPVREESRGAAGVDVDLNRPLMVARGAAGVDVTLVGFRIGLDGVRAASWASTASDNVGIDSVVA